MVVPVFPRWIGSAIAGLEEANNLARENPPPDSDPIAECRVSNLFVKINSPQMNALGDLHAAIVATQP